MKSVVKFLLLMLLFFNVSYVFAEEKQKLKVLIIEINPILSTIENHDLYMNILIKIEIKL